MRRVACLPRLVGALLAGSTLLGVRGALAQPRLGANAVGLQLSSDASVLRLSSLPSVKLGGESEEGTPLPSGWLRSPGPSTMLAWGMGIDLVLRDRMVMPLFNFTMAFSVGERPTVYGSVDGRVVEMHPWKSQHFMFFLGGVGVRWKHRRWMGSAVLHPGFSVTYTEVLVGDESIRASGVHLALRATLEGCRRLDPESRVCLFGGPNLYNEVLVNGAFAGLRLEVGP